MNIAYLQLQFGPLRLFLTEKLPQQSTCGIKLKMIQLNDEVSYLRAVRHMN